MENLEHVQEITEESSAPVEFDKLFTFGTLVTNKDEYFEMVASAVNAGFGEECSEYLYLDNSQDNNFDGYSGLNKLMISAKGRYLVFCHQDVLFQFDGCKVLLERISELDALDKSWAVLGNAGKKEDGSAVVRISDPGESNVSWGTFPSKVMSLDENFIVVRRDSLVGCNVQLSGFHLYGLDLVNNAYQLGYSAYVVDFHLLHKSAGNADKSYYDVQRQIMEVYRKKMKGKVFQAMCSRFFVSNSKLLNLLINQKWLLNLHKSVKRKRCVK